ncbi:prepilin peptidase [Agromyces archimandritae]|uniref:Prepilin peptidase n=1 Tax=Agromyces archimandritae TaxID=2781962 RepID=A0A975IMN1_9MICO|nr:A24 family peptidase [Agromyces archimandritae]QTX03635.1 prepilin peptidase [Agromyces archimandritae]
MTVILLGGATVFGWAAGWWPIRTVANAHAHGARLHRPGVRTAIAVAAAAAFGLVAWGVGWSPLLPAALLFTAAGVAAAAVDLVEHRLPNAILAAGTVTVLAAIVVASWVHGWGLLFGSLAGGAAMLASYAVVALISPRSMGMGDVKLAGFIGLTLGAFGVTPWLVGLVAAFILGGIVALAALVSRRASLASVIPFGPSMVAGAIVALALG